MSQQITQPANDITAKSRQIVPSYQPVWMAHWMRTSSNKSAARRNRPEEGVTNESLRTSLKSLGNDGMCTKELRPMLAKNLESGNNVINFPWKIIPSMNELSLGGFYSPSEGTSSNPFEWMKTRPLTHILSYYDDLEKYELDKGKAIVCPLVEKPFTVSSNNQSPYAEHSEERMNSVTSINACLRGFNTSLLFDRDWFQKMQQISGIKFFPTPSEEDKSDNKSRFGFYSLNKLSNNMRICTAVDSVEAMPRSRPSFSHTTHSMVVTKKGNADLQENDVFRGKHFVKKTKTNENTVFGEGSSSSNSEGRNNVQNDEGREDTTNDESSERTDTTEMNFFKEKNVDSGANATPSTKAFEIISNSSPPTVVAASRKTECRLTKNVLPDINLEPPAVPAVETSPENLCPNSSKTQSSAEQTQTKPNINPDDPNPSNRWVKRLKLSSPNSSPQSTKITNPDENLSHDKMRKYIHSIPDSTLTSSEPSPRNNKFHGKETNVSDRSIELPKESLFSHIWIKRWLRDCSRVIEGKSDPTVRKVYGSKMSLDDDDLEKKQFPSIGAMALMRKAMGGFRSCEIQKRGSVTVWNTKGTS